jgi:hypothetical protein
MDTLFLLGEHATIRDLLQEMEHRREALWTEDEGGGE